MGEMLKQDGSIWLGLALVELSEESVLMGWIGPRYGILQPNSSGCNLRL